MLGQHQDAWNVINLIGRINHRQQFHQLTTDEKNNITMWQESIPRNRPGFGALLTR